MKNFSFFQAQARPVTAVRGAGYSSAASGGGGRTSTFQTTTTPSAGKIELTAEEECKRIEASVNDLLEQSIFAYEKGEFRTALERAKEAGRMERKAVKRREMLQIADATNLDLTFNVLFNLAHQYTVNDMYNEALNTYQASEYIFI